MVALIRTDTTFEVRFRTVNGCKWCNAWFTLSGTFQVYFCPSCSCNPILWLPHNRYRPFFGSKDLDAWIFKNCSIHGKGGYKGIMWVRSWQSLQAIRDIRLYSREHCSPASGILSANGMDEEGATSTASSSVSSGSWWHQLEGPEKTTWEEQVETYNAVGAETCWNMSWIFVTSIRSCVSSLSSFSTSRFCAASSWLLRTCRERCSLAGGEPL